MAINLIDGFHVGNNLPIDDRFIFATTTARDALDSGMLYDGLITYVTGNNTIYIYDSTESKWNTLATEASIQAALAAIETEIGQLTAAGVHFKGSIDASTTHLTPAASIGDIYVISAAGTVDTVEVEAGDMLIAKANVAAATEQTAATVANSWTFVQANISIMKAATSEAAGASGYVPTPAAGSQVKYLRGDATWSAISISEVTGLQTALDNRMLIMDSSCKDELIIGGASSDTVTGSGVKINTSAALGTSTTYVPVENVVKTYADGKITKLSAAAENEVILGGATATAVKASGKTLGGSTIAATPTANVLATEAAVKTYADGKIAGLSAAAANKIILGDSTATTVKSSGVDIGGATLASTPTSTTVATEAAVKTYADGKVTALSAVAEDKVLLGGGTVTSVKSSGKAIGGTTLAATPDGDTLATEVAVKTYADGKIDALSAAAENKIILGGASATTVKSSGATLKTSGSLSTSASAIPAEKLVKAYADTKISQLSAAAADQIILGGSAKNTVAASGKTIGGATLSSTPNANTVATEAAVAAAITGSNVGDTMIFSNALGGTTATVTNISFASGMVVQNIVIKVTTAYASTATLTISSGATTLLNAFPIGKMSAGDMGYEIIFTAGAADSLTFTFANNTGNVGAATVYVTAGSPAVLAALA